MNCKGKNRLGKPCGNLALNGSEFCAYHQPKPTQLRTFSRKIALITTILVFLIGLIADFSGTVDVIKSIGNKSTIKVGVDLIEGGASTLTNGTDLSKANYSGATQSSEYETVLHLAFQESAGECLALGISLFNESEYKVKNIRVHVTLPPAGQIKHEFCEQFKVALSNTFKKDDIIRKFSNVSGTPIANYQISEIGPNEIAFLTVPLRKKANLFLKEEGGRVHLHGIPSEIIIQTYSDRNPKSTYAVQLYLQKVSDISQAITDDGLLWVYHSLYTRRATSNFRKILSKIPFLRKYSGPSYTEYILGYFDIPNVSSTPNYSIVRPPIVKNVVESKQNSSVQLALKKYQSLKDDICVDIVRMEEGEDYPCLVPPQIIR